MSGRRMVRCCGSVAIVRFLFPLSLSLAVKYFSGYQRDQGKVSFRTQFHDHSC
jgi:hypothetical protein